ncbi:MAG: tetratricopeptide repeat protein, partial [Bacteroidales bacterium]|nr:tetratricopeptide repeat protein [Bacteroidales bacterium]
MIALLCACNEHKANDLATRNMSPRETLSRAEAMMTQAPDSALILLEDLSKGALRGRENRAHFALLYSQALDKNYIDLANDSIIRVAVDYYAPRKDNNRKMLAYYYLGRVQYNAKEYQKAIVSLMQAEVAAKLSRDNFYLGLIYRSMSEIHCDIYSFTEAIRYAKSSYEHFHITDDQHYADWSLWDIGRAFHNAAQYDSSIVYAKRVVENAKLRQDSVLLGDALLLLGNSYASSKLYEESINTFIKIDTLKIGSMKAENYLMIGISYYAIGEIEKANRIMETLVKVDPSNKWLTYQLQKHQGNYKESLLALESEISKSNNRYLELINQTVTKATNDYLQQENMLQEKELQKAKQSKCFFICCLLFCLILIILACHIIKQEMKIRDEEIEKNIIIASQLRNMLKASQNENQELQNALDGLFNQHFATIDQLSATYYEMHAAKNEKEAIYKKVKKEIENFSSDMKTLQELENIVNEHKNNVMAILRQEFPEFSEMDFRLLCYCIAGFSAKAISVFTGDSTNNIYQRKSRLKNVITQSSSP